MSQTTFPKQFLSVFNNTPLIAQTINRIKTYFNKNERVLIIPADLRKLVYKFVGSEKTIIEPVRRNTAPAICLTAMKLKKQYGDGILHVMPADHLITPKKNFIDALKCGQDLAARGYLVTYGVLPTRPETGYGYIKTGKKLNQFNGAQVFETEGFIEKPSLVNAKKFIKSKIFLWNSGIFSFRITDILKEIEHHIPDVYHGVIRFINTRKKKHFQRMPDISIDYGVMEKSKKLCIVKGNFVWDDVGSWLALERYFNADKKNNICLGDVKGLEIEDSILYTKKIPLRVYGAKGSVIVVSEDGVLVCNKKYAPNLKKLVE